MLRTVALREQLRDEYLERRDPIAADRLRWRAQSFRHIVHLLPGQSILEIGCGQGFFTRQLVKITRDRNPITAVTFRSCSDKAADWPASVEMFAMEAFPGVLEGREFDFIVAMDLLDQRNCAAVLQQVYGMLKPGGKILFYESNPWNVVLKLRRALAHVFGQSDPRHLLSRDRLYELMSEVGFIRIFAVFNDFVFAPLSPRLIWLLRNLSIILENAPGIRTLAGSILVHAQKPPRMVERPAVSLTEHHVLRRAVSVVVPCYNEEMNIEPLVNSLRRFYDEYLHEIILVDDNSNDRTAAVIRQMADSDNRIQLVSRTGPNGVGRALLDGYRTATGRYILSMDCDFQHLLPELSDLFDEAVKGCDVVVGSRFSRHSVLLNYPFGKIVANRAFHLIAQILFLRRFRDLTNNLKLFRREVVDQLLLLEPWFAVNAETGLQPLIMGYQVKEVPISWINRTPDMGMSSFQLATVGWGYWRVLGRLWLRSACGIGAYQSLSVRKEAGHARLAGETEERLPVNEGRPGDRVGTVKKVVSERVLGPGELRWFWTLTVFGLAAIGLFLSSWFRLPAWSEHPFFMAALSVILSVFLTNNFARWWLLRAMKRPTPIEPKPGWKVAAVTTFVPGSEPLELLEQTLKALVALEYPHDTWVLDEGDDDRVKPLCQILGVSHFSRKHHPHYQSESGMFRKASKHGNYNAWLHEVGFERYDILSAFDPDHVPNRNFLTKVLGYFDVPNIGYVQGPQIYSNKHASFIARGAAEEACDFYSTVQMACYGKGFPLIIGCHNTHRMAALRECGGFASHDADDLYLTLLYNSRGWQGVYVPEILARGLAPVDWPTYLNQQRRWTRSVLDLKLRIAPSMTHRLPPTAMVLNALHGLNYVHKSLVLPLAMMLVALMLVFGDMPDIANADTMVSGALMITLLQIWQHYRQRFYFDEQSSRGFLWRAGLLQFAKWPYQLAAFGDVILNRQFPYIITPKTGGLPRPLLVLWPHMSTIGIMGLAWGIGLAIHRTIPTTIQVCAGAILFATFGLLVTEWRQLLRYKVHTFLNSLGQR
jgi:cellulose synthase/poly-beta-1,6-N-acetylglucosamine synthase-like glycosyltransferase/SAM-dependent methyltransferase